jgi:hypothetical protein
MSAEIRVLTVGDAHVFRVDKPLYDAADLITNFTRVESFGEAQVLWVRVVVDPATNHVFEFHQEIIPNSVGVGWSEYDRPAPNYAGNNILVSQEREFDGNL